MSARPWWYAARSSSAGSNDGQHRGCKVARRFLRQIMAGRRNHSALIRGREEPIVMLGACDRGDSIVTTVQHDGRHGYRSTDG